ncbi:MAG: hypothetical protein FWD14_07325 [Treponema sp.]|nr:hypothetical protein [Treponema sp.]
MKKFSYELGSDFTWVNPAYTNQRGWTLDQKVISQVADGTIKRLVIVLDAAVIQADGGLGGIEIILNSQNNGINLDYRSYPWNWRSDTQTGGYISYSDLLSEGHATISEGKLYLMYDLTSHPNFPGFKKEMSSAEWGQISIQYGIGMRIFPFVTAFLQG